MNPNYKILRGRARAIKNKEDAARVEKLATQIYDAGQITAIELKHVDVLIMETLAKIEP